MKIQPACLVRRKVTDRKSTRSFGEMSNLRYHGIFGSKLGSRASAVEIVGKALDGICQFKLTPTSRKNVEDTKIR
jgi:hypothetical protein